VSRVDFHFGTVCPKLSASEALARIAALYAIEKTITGHSADQRRAVRQERSKPLVLALKAWLEQQLTRVSSKATIGEHIRYALNHWDGLTRFLDTAASNSTPTSSSEASALLSSIAKTRCSRGMIRARRIGPASLR
jgi:Transposase IS66 family